MKTSAILIATILSTLSSLYANDNSNKLSSIKNEMPMDRSSETYRKIHTEALVQLVRSSHPLMMIVDARDEKIDDGKRIPSAKPIPAYAPIGHITANLPDKEAMIIVYCSNAQCQASEQLANRLVKMGYKNVWVYPEGIEGWEKSGQKVEQGKSAAKSAAETGPKSA